MNTLKRYQLISTYLYEISCHQTELTYKLEIYQSGDLFKGVVLYPEFYALTPAFPTEQTKQKQIAHEELYVIDHYFAEQDLLADTEQHLIQLFENKIAYQLSLKLGDRGKVRTNKN